MQVLSSCTKAGFSWWEAWGPSYLLGGRLHVLHDGPFRWVWRLHKELESSTRAVVRGPEGPLMGATPAELIWGQFLL